MNREEIIRNFIAAIDENHRVVRKDGTIILGVTGQAPDGVSVYGCVPWSERADRNTVCEVVSLQQGRYFFNFQAYVDHASLVTFNHTPTEPSGYTFEQMIDRIIYKQRFAK
jgi:hypothetical protein